jgi:hypothetical protein
MPNMSYCRFENTAGDVLDCVNALDEAIADGDSFKDFTASLSSDQERWGLKYMIEHCRRFVELYDEFSDEDD